MKSLKKAACSRQGIGALIGIAAGIFISCFGGYLLKGNEMASDFVILFGSIISLAGTQTFCRAVISFREEEN